MQTILIVIHLIVVVALVVLVLMQRSEGGALGIGGGGGLMTGRGQANVLTRATSILAAIFFATSLALTLLANSAQEGSKSILQGVTPPASSSTKTAVPPKANGTLLDQLKKIEQQRQQQGAPGSAPAPAAPQPSAPK